jgi:hypothetical protein
VHIATAEKRSQAEDILRQAGAQDISLG